MKYNRSVQDQYQRPDSGDEGMNRIHARFDRLARKMKNVSGVGQIESICPADNQDAPVFAFAQSQQELFPLIVT